MTAPPITVQHSGGSSIFNLNQRVNGGQWNLLGTLTSRALNTIASVWIDSARVVAAVLGLE